MRGVSRPPLLPPPAAPAAAAPAPAPDPAPRRLKANHTATVRSTAAAAQPTAMPAICPPLRAGLPPSLLLLAPVPAALAGELAAVPAAEPASEVAGADGAGSGCSACCACCGSGAGAGAAGAESSSALPSCGQLEVRIAVIIQLGTLLPTPPNVQAGGATTVQSKVHTLPWWPPSNHTWMGVTWGRPDMVSPMPSSAPASASCLHQWVCTSASCRLSQHPSPYSCCTNWPSPNNPAHLSGELACWYSTSGSLPDAANTTCTSPLPVPSSAL